MQTQTMGTIVVATVYETYSSEIYRPRRPVLRAAGAARWPRLALRAALAAARFSARALRLRSRMALNTPKRSIPKVSRTSSAVRRGQAGCLQVKTYAMSRSAATVLAVGGALRAAMICIFTTCTMH